MQPKSDLDKIIRGCDNFRQMAKYLENKQKELSNAIQELLTQQGAGDITDSAGATEISQDSTYPSYDYQESQSELTSGMSSETN